MSWIHPRVWLSGLLALVFVIAGCSKDDGTADANKPFTLPGASKVLEALDKKDYENTVSGLAEIKGTVTPKTQDEFRRLRQKVLEIGRAS